MAENRQHLIHLHGTGEVTANVLTNNNVEKGELVVRHFNGGAELFTFDDNKNLAKFITETAVNALVNAEKERAMGVEGGLQTAIDAINNGTTGILAQAKAYTDELANGAVSANTAALATLNGDENTAGSVAAAVKAEKDRAEGVESGFETRLDDIETLLGVGGETEGSISEKVTNLEAAVGNPSAEGVPATGLYASVEANAAAIAKEVTDRQTAIETAVKAEEDRAKGVEAGLQTAIDAINNETTGILATAKAYTDTQVSAETTARETAITNLKNNEIKANADAIAKEVSDRQGAVNGLQGQIDAINSTENGILVTAKAYTDAEVTKLKNNEIKANADAIAQEILDRQAAVSAETTARETAVNGLNERVTKNEGDIKSLQDSVAGLASATHFIGITTTELVDDATTSPIMVNEKEVTPANGDIVIYNNSEFIWDGAKWEKLGDTTAELAAIELLKGEDTAIKGRLDVIEGEAEGSIKKAAADALDSAKSYTDTQLNAFKTGDFKTLSDAVSANTTAIETEKGRAEAAEIALGERIDGVNTVIEENEKVTSEALNNLKGRLDGVDTTLGEHTASISANTTAIATEKSRAEAAETALGQRIDNISVVAGDGISVTPGENKVFTVAVTTIDCGLYE